MNQELLIVVERVSRWYGSRLALNDISFTVRRGEVLGFLGPNGAGKTTTMQIVCGVLAPHGGRVTVAGCDMAGQPMQAKAHIGYLPENPPLYRDLSVDQYLHFCAGLRGLPRRARAAAVANSKERCGLGDAGRRLIGNLSRGYQQRVGIAQAIVHAPAAVILDEPTVGLDPKQIVEIRELIRELGEDHSVMLSTHILSEVQSTCDRVVIIHHGNLLVDQSMDTLSGGGPARHWTVAFTAPPVPEELEAVPGVAGIQVLDRNRFRITFASAADGGAAGLAEHAARAGWGLYELVPEAGTLEETFLRVTGGDPPVLAGQDA